MIFLVVAALLGLYILYYLLFLVSKVELICETSELNNEAISATPLLKSWYWPTLWVFNRHLQGILMMKLRKEKKPFLFREVIYSHDGAKLVLDWVEKPNPKTKKTTILMLSGITGNSKSSYLTFLADEFSKLGWNCVVMNFPGAFPDEISLATPRIHGIPSDVRSFVNHVVSSAPNDVLFALGFSLGAHLWMSYLGEEAEQSKHIPIKACVVCSSPWHMKICHEHWNSWVSLNVYDRHFLQRFSSVVRNNRKVFEKANLGVDEILSVGRNEELLESLEFIMTIENATQAKNMEEFDSLLHLPLSKASTISEMLDVHNSRKTLMHVQTPFLAVHAMNDPVVPPEAVPLEDMKKHKYGILAITSTGGHTGWLSGLWPVELSWIEKLMLEYLQYQNRKFNRSQDK